MSKRAGGAEFVDLDGVIDDQFDWLQRIDQGGVAAQLLHGVAHGGEIDYAGDAGEILKEDAAGGEGDFFVGLGFAVPVRQGADFFFGHVAAVFGAQQVLQQDAQREGQMFGGDALLVERVEAVDFVFFVADFEGRAGVEAVHRHDGLPCGITGWNATLQCNSFAGGICRAGVLTAEKTAHEVGTASSDATKALTAESAENFHCERGDRLPNPSPQGTQRTTGENLNCGAFGETYAAEIWFCSSCVSVGPASELAATGRTIASRVPSWPDRIVRDPPSSRTRSRIPAKPMPVLPTPVSK